MWVCALYRFFFIKIYRKLWGNTYRGQQGSFGIMTSSKDKYHVTIEYLDAYASHAWEVTFLIEKVEEKFLNIYKKDS